MIFTSWAFGGQGVGRHHPAALGRELEGEVGLVVAPVVRLEAEGDQRQLLLLVADHLETTVAAQAVGQGLWRSACICCMT